MSFALNVPLTTQTLDALKGYLTRSIPEIKSSHRCEALARALGYRTYAGLLHAATHDAGGCAAVEAGPFHAYLAKHELRSSGEHLYRAVAAAALCAVGMQEPRLTVWGIGAGDPKRKPEGGLETAREREHRFRKEREQLSSDYNTLPFLLSLALVSRIQPTATIRSGAFSYKLKHIAENYGATYPDGTALGPVYVPNGMLIAAAIHTGFRYRTFVADTGYEDVNATFNMSKRAIEDLDCEIRPDGATAQDRARRKN